MSSDLPNCSPIWLLRIYKYICPECAHERPMKVSTDYASEDVLLVRDADGNVLQDGGIVAIVKNFKVKVSASVVKVDAKVRMLA